MATRHISQRELRNESGNIMRALRDGDSFVVTSNGVPVGTLEPVRPSCFSNTRKAQEAFRGTPRINASRFRSDVDAFVDQDPTPRA